jgi:serine/threonine protein kinase
MIRQAAEGVAFLHSLSIVHRNIKARNFLITVLHGSEYVIKLTDMDFSKNIEMESAVNSRQRDPKWPAPELLKEGSPLSIKVDSFSLGWFFYYVFSKGSHPYDGNQYERSRILESGIPVTKERWSLVPHAPIEWIKLMMNHKAEDRPTVEQVLRGEVPENVTSGPWADYFQPDDVYVLYEDNKRPGLCVVYNQFTDRFEKELQEKLKRTLTEDEAKVVEEKLKKIRKGTDEDCQSLIETFKAKGFDVKVREDVTAKDLESSITYLGRNWDTKYNSLVICILSHGSEGHVECVDLNAVKISRLMYCLNSEECRGLNGKPKLFIIQACQGNNRMLAGSEADKMDIDQGNFVKFDSNRQ